MSLMRGPKLANSLSNLDFSCETEETSLKTTAPAAQRNVLVCDQSVPACWGTGGAFLSAPDHSGSTWVSSEDRGPETEPDATLPPSSWPSFAPVKQMDETKVLWVPVKSVGPKSWPAQCRHYQYITLSSSVSFSFFSFSLSTAFSSQRLALAFKSLAPPEMTPDFWNRVPSRATV